MSATIRTAREPDIAQAAEVIRTCWPEGMSLSEDDLSSILATFPEGFIVAEKDGDVVGVITSLRVSRHDVIDSCPSWHVITDEGRIAGTHRPDGDCLFMMAVSVSPSAQKLSLGKRLVNAEVSLGARLPGVEYVWGYTRIPHYNRRPDVSADEYVKQTDSDGRPLDPVLRFHVKNGAQVIRPVPGARPNDGDSLGYGVLISYEPEVR